MPLAALGPILAGAAGTSAAATAGAWGAIGAGVAAGTSLYGAHKQSEATNKALSAQEQANQQAIDYEKAQLAEQKRQFDAAQAQAKAEYDAEQARRAPYRAAGLQALGTLGQMLGQSFDTSAYQPPPNPYQTGSSSTAATATPAGDWTNPSAQQIAGVLQQTGQDPNTVGYWQQKWPELVARGQQLGDPNYALKRLQGWQASAADRPTAGPYAMASGAPRSMAAVQPTAMMLPTTTNATAANYAPVIPLSNLIRRSA